MYLHHSVVSSAYRFYKSKNGYNDREEYDGITSVMWMSDTEVYLHGAVVNEGYGKYVLIMILHDLINKGVTIVKLARASGRTVPFGEMIETHEHENLWKIDLTDEKTITRINKLYEKIPMS